MVKNTHGGNRHKGFARKHTNVKESNKLRVSEDDAEIYAIVTKMCGNNMFHCHCIDDVTRLGHIRGKFSGRRKGGHFITPGTWILIGLREWDSKEDAKTASGKKKLQECDLLEVYDDTNKHRLIDNLDENWSILNAHDVGKKLTGEKDDGDDMFSFSNERDEERERLMAEINTTGSERIALRITENEQKEEEEINIDDI
jgi:translation initiation factor 1A